jgi:hypothetical protein
MRTSALIASEPVQPLQRFLHHNLHHHGGRHLSAQCGRLTGLGREPISFERPGDVRFGAHSGLKLDIAALPKSANNGD